MAINTATATYKQYETCEHRSGNLGMGAFVDHYDTPCPVCQALEAQVQLGVRVVALLVLLAILTYLIA